MQLKKKKNPTSPSLASSCKHVWEMFYLSSPFSLSIHLLSIHSVRSAAAEPALTGSLLIISGQEAILKCMTPPSCLRISFLRGHAGLQLDLFWGWACKVTLPGLGGHWWNWRRTFDHLLCWFGGEILSFSELVSIHELIVANECLCVPVCVCGYKWDKIRGLNSLL